MEGKKQMAQKTVETKSLIVSAAVNLIMGIAGIAVFLLTKINALFLDGAFSIIGFISTVFAIVISRESSKKTKTFPNGMYFLEPLYAIGKGLLTLSLLFISSYESGRVAYLYFFKGQGEVMDIGPILPYTVCMVTLCFSLSVFNRSQNRKINNMSTMLAAESKSNLVDGIISMGVGIAILMLYFIDINGQFGFLHYTADFFITIVLVLISLKQPIETLATGFREFAHGVTDNHEVKNNIDEVLRKHLGEGVENYRVDIYKQGMFIKLELTIKNHRNAALVQKSAQMKDAIYEDLKKRYESIMLEINI